MSSHSTLVQSVTLTLSPRYGWVILTATAIGIQCVSFGGIAGRVRQKYQIPYPDMGNGRYSKDLTDEQWVDFNNAQRVHYHYIEGITPALFFQLAGGLFVPEVAASAGLFYFLGRFAMAYGYMKFGPRSSLKLFGNLVVDLALLVNATLCIYSSVKLLM